MAVHDQLPRGVQTSVDHHIRNLERQADPVKDTLATLRVLAPALLIGMEDDVRALDKMIESIRDRWGYYVARGAWAATEEVNDHLNSLPQATGKVVPGDVKETEKSK